MISAPTAIHSRVSMPCSSFRYPTIFFIPASSCAHRVLCGEACDGTTLDFTFDLSSLLLSLESCGLPPPPHPDVSPLGCTSYALTSANPLHSRASTTAAIRSLGTRNPTAPDSTSSSSFSETSPSRPACSSTSKTSGAWLPLWSSFTTTSDSALLTLDPSPTSAKRRRCYSNLNRWCSWKSSGCTAGDVPGSMKFGRRWQDAQTRQAVESDCARDTNPGASEAQLCVAAWTRTRNNRGTEVSGRLFSASYQQLSPFRRPAMQARISVSTREGRRPARILHGKQ